MMFDGLPTWSVLGCLDHFLENEVYENSWDSLYSILTDPSLYDIVIDVGLPLLHRNCRYNARAIILDGKILCLRPKLYLANDGNFREMRFFTPWNRPRHVEQYYLPPLIQKHQGRRHVPIGDVVLSTIDTCLAAETCEELFTPNSPHINMYAIAVRRFPVALFLADSRQGTQWCGDLHQQQRKSPFAPKAGPAYCPDPGGHPQERRGLPVLQPARVRRGSAVSDSSPWTFFGQDGKQDMH